MKFTWCCDIQSKRKEKQKAEGDKVKKTNKKKVTTDLNPGHKLLVQAIKIHLDVMHMVSRLRSHGPSGPLSGSQRGNLLVSVTKRNHVFLPPANTFNLTSRRECA